jgi:hypothetical protein
VIELPPLGELDVELWHALLDIADRMPSDWTLIGGQMVLLHALEHGRAPQRVSEDLDLVVDARVRPLALPRMLSTLGDLGFAEAAISHDEVAHRFSRGRTNVDVLAPDGVGSRADLRTVGAARTVEVGGRELCPHAIRPGQRVGRRPLRRGPQARSRRRHPH